MKWKWLCFSLLNSQRCAMLCLRIVIIRLTKEESSFWNELQLSNMHITLAYQASRSHPQLASSALSYLLGCYWRCFWSLGNARLSRLYVDDRRRFFFFFFVDSFWLLARGFYVSRFRFLFQSSWYFSQGSTTTITNLREEIRRPSSEWFLPL